MASWIDGISFPLPEDVLLAQETARNFAESEIKPLAAKIDHEHYYPEEIIQKLGQLGFLGITVPAKYSGSELSYTAYALIIEELAAACASTSVIVSAHNSLCLWPINEFGTEEQKLKFIPPLATGANIGCFALSEPGTGSDAACLTCTATKRGDEYVINGTKNWITNAPVASTCVLFTMQDASKGNKGITAFVHPMNLKGISRGKKENKLGICGSPTASIMYDNVLLTKEHLLGEELKGFKVAMSTLNGGRIGIASQAVGIARSALSDALRYSKERKTFGKFLHEHQSIQNYLADMVTQIDAARYLAIGAAILKDGGKPYARQAAQAKLFASEIAMAAANKGIQIHGGYGYVKEFPAERHLRDAKITEIYEGTSEIQRIVIASHLAGE